MSDNEPQEIVDETNLLHKPALPRIVEGGCGGDGLLALFQALVLDAEMEERDTAQMVVGYFEEGDEFVEGTYVPELWLVARKVTDD